MFGEFDGTCAADTTAAPQLGQYIELAWSGAPHLLQKRLLPGGMPIVEAKSHAAPFAMSNAIYNRLKFR